MKRVKLKSIQSRFVLGAFVGALLLLLLFAGIVYFVGGRVLAQEKLLAAAFSASYSAEQINGWFGDKRVRLETLHHAFPSLTEDWQKADILARVYEAYGRTFLPYVGFSDGTAIFGDEWIPDDGWDPRTRDWYIDAMNNRGLAVFSTPYVDASTEEMVVTISKEFGHMGDRGMVFAADIFLDDVVHMVDSAMLIHGSFALMVDREGTVLVHTRDPVYYAPRIGASGMVYPNISQIDIFMQFAEHDVAEYEFRQVRDTEAWYMSYVRIPETGWTLYFVVPRSFVMADTYRLLLQAGLVLLPCVLLLMLMAWYSMNRAIVKPIKKLEGLVSDVTNGKVHVNRDPGLETGDEIGRLADDMYGLTDSIRRILDDTSKFSHEIIVNGDIDYRMDEQAYSGAYMDMVQGVNHLVNSLVTDVNAAIGCMVKIGRGDFDVSIADLPGKKIALTNTIREIVANLQEIFQSVSVMAEKATNGDFGSFVAEDSFGGKWSTLAAKLNGLIKAVEVPLSELGSNLVLMSRGDYSRLEGKYSGTFNVLKEACNLVNDKTKAYISEISHVLQSMADGDLTLAIENDYEGSFAPIEAAITAIIQSLNSTVMDLGRVAESVSEGSVKLSINSAELSEGVARQLLAMQSLSEGIVDVETQSKSNSTSARKASELVQLSKERAEEGNLQMKKLLVSMDEINASSNKISEITKTIENIAFQINLLSLNAAIEAARAGVHGRGFSVVAEEVRSLASKSDEAAKRTAAIIKDSISSVKNGIEQVNGMAESLSSIVRDVVSVSDIVESINESSVHQSEAIGEITKSMGDINSVAQRASDASVNTAQAAHDLDAQVAILRRKLGFFKTRLGTMPTMSDLLRASTSGRQLSAKRLVNVDQTRVNFGDGDVIIAEGCESEGCMYIVEEGAVNVYKFHGRPKQILLATLGPGSIVGEMSLFLNEPRSATVVASGSAVLLEIRQSDMHKFIENNPDVAFTLVETLCMRLGNLLRDLGVN